MHTQKQRKMETIEIKIKGDKNEVKKAIEFMVKQLGSDGLVHLVEAYKGSPAIKSLVKAEVAKRKATGKVKKIGRGILDKIRD